MGNKERQITSLDMIAGQAGVSKSVVSRVLSGQAEKYRISGKTAARVEEEARRSLYDLRKVPAARKRKSGFMGLLVPSLSDPYFSHLAGFVVSCLDKKGYLCTPMETANDEETLRKGAVTMLLHGAEALIVVPCGKENGFLEKVDSQIAPVILLDHFYSETSLSYVTSDNFQGAADAVRYLVSEGHRNISCIRGDSSILTGEERVRGYLHAMSEAGLDHFKRVVGGKEFSVDEGRTQARALLESENPPTAIFTLSHALVVGVIEVVREMGLRIPEDIMLMSFDNNIHTDHLVPHISQPMEDMAKLVTQTACDRLNGARTGTTHIRLSPKLYKVGAAAAAFFLSIFPFTSTAGNVRESPDTLALGGSVITSLKTGGRLRESPATVAVATSFDAKRLPSPTIADIFRREPGISKGGDGIWATNIHIRGLGENRLVTLTDGCRVEVASDLTTSLSMFDVNDIERIEVIKGAQSSIYGSGAIGGIINVVMKDGHFSETPYFSGNATGSYTSANNGHSEYLALYAGGRNWYLKLNGSFAAAADTRTPAGMLTNSGYHRADAGVVAAFRPAAGQTLKLRFQKDFSWDVGIPGGAAFTPSAEAAYRHADRTLASLGYDIMDLTPNLVSLGFKAFYQGIVLDVTMDPNMPKPVTGAMPTLVTPYAEHHTIGASGESRWRFGSHNNLTAGVETWRRAITSDRAKYIDQYAEGVLAARLIRREIPLPDASCTSAGIYLQDEMRLLEDRLTVTLGGRADINFVRNGECHNVESIENLTAGTVIGNPPGKYTTFEAGFRSTPSWSANAGLLFRATDRLDITLNASRSYRSPALEELFKFIDLAGNKIHLGNTGLKPEKGTGGDLGIRFHSDRLDFSAVGFINAIGDMIVERKVNVDPASVNDTLKLTNASRALLYGAEMNIDYEILKGLKASVTGTLNVGKETSAKGKWLPMIPPAVLTAGLSYENSRILGADLGITAAAARPEGKIADGERPTGAWCRLDLAVHSKIFSIGRCNLQIFGGVDNVTDTAYTNFLSTNRGNIVCEPGRNVYLRMNLTF